MFPGPSAPPIQSVAMGSVFLDRAVQPEGPTIRAALGSSADAWELVTATLGELGVAVTWRHYRDGGWLAKATLGRRTIAWLAVEDGFVRVTVHFAERYRTTLTTLPGLPDAVVDRIAATPPGGRLLPVTSEIRTREDVAVVRVILEAKLAAE